MNFQSLGKIEYSSSLPCSLVHQTERSIACWDVKPHYPSLPLSLADDVLFQQINQWKKHLADIWLILPRNVFEAENIQFYLNAFTFFGCNVFVNDIIDIMYNYNVYVN